MLPMFSLRNLCLPQGWKYLYLVCELRAKEFSIYFIVKYDVKYSFL